MTSPLIVRTKVAALPPARLAYFASSGLSQAGNSRGEKTTQICGSNITPPWPRQPFQYFILSCTHTNSIFSRVDTREPFFGMVHAADREDPGCSEVGRGGLKTFLTVDLATSACGVKYDEVRSQMCRFVQTRLKRAPSVMSIPN